MDVSERCLAVAGLIVLLVSGSGCGSYEVNTFRFIPTAKNNVPTDGDVPIPNIWIDTNTKLSGLTGGTLTSELPCAVRIDYTDNQQKFRDIVLTSVKITYNDGIEEKSTDDLQLPYHIAGRNYESINSGTGGRIIKTNNWIISDQLPKLITRSQPFKLQLEGHFTKRAGGQSKFAIDQSFEFRKEQGTKKASEVLPDK